MSSLMNFVCIYIDSDYRYEEDDIEHSYLKLPHNEHGFIALLAELRDDNCIYYKDQYVLNWDDFSNRCENITINKYGLPYGSLFIITNEDVGKYEGEDNDCLWFVENPILFDNIPIIKAWICIQHLHPTKITKYQNMINEYSVDTVYKGPVKD